MIPIAFKPFLWSYNFDTLDKEKNKDAIISSILNYGTIDTWPILFEIYDKKEITDVFSSHKDSWNKKSRNFWNLVLHI